MIRYQVLLSLLAALMLSALSGSETQAKELPQLKGVKRILFLGDSITYAGQYIDYIEMYLETHSQDRIYEIIDMGLPSETVSGLTEPGHAGGAFPRPVLSERLDRVLHKVRPDLVFACYGMNDGIYYPFGEDRFAKYREGIENLVKKVTAQRARIILITPPPFDALAIKGQTLPAGKDEYRQPYEGYDEVLAQYSKWLLQQGKHGWHVINIHTPIDQYLTDQRKVNPDFHLAGDGVHLGEEGHWLIAREILEYLGAAKPLVKPTGELQEKLLGRVHSLRSMLTDSWLTDVGHMRPGMAVGLPINAALLQARSMEEEIRTLAAGSKD